MSTETATRRLHWGCGRSVAPGWINADRVDHGGVDVVGDALVDRAHESLFVEAFA
jgi:predicted SAM-dependent methyltransferase